MYVLKCELMRYRLVFSIAAAVCALKRELLQDQMVVYITAPLGVCAEARMVAMKCAGFNVIVAKRLGLVAILSVMTVSMLHD